jgi:hypothetical protein
MEVSDPHGFAAGLAAVYAAYIVLLVARIPLAIR